MTRSIFFLVIMAALGSFLAESECWAKVIHVPSDQPSTQAGIEAASNGDTVEVAPGTYFENINFKGKLITVTSTGGPKVTTIDGHRAGAVATFSSKETRAAVLSGFTLTNGIGFFNGGGIYIQNASPTISGNIITHNIACSGGGGIGVLGGSPLIKNNQITSNGQAGCTGGGGGGIELISPGSAEVVSNLISNNSWTAGFGGGMDVFAGSETLLIKDNIITGNSASGVHSSAPDASGGGIATSGGTFVQNLIFKNTADLGGGVYYGSPLTAPTFVNNTIVDNFTTQSQGSALYADYSKSAAVLYNNLLIGTDGQNAVFCLPISAAQPVFNNNDAFSQGANAFEGGCVDEIGKSGNISENPIFANVALDNFRLLAGSPGIDMGLNSAPGLPATDLEGGPRIVDGTGDGKFIIDMGAYEFQPVTVAPTSIDFGVQSVSSHTTRGVVLTNHQESSLSISNITAGGEFSPSSSCPAVLAAGTSCTISATFAPTAVGPSTATLTVKDNDTNGPRQVALSGIGVSPGTPVILTIPHTILVGSSFVINGIGFTAASKVNFFVATAAGPVNAGPFTPMTETASQLTIAVPDTVSLGQGFVSVQVVNTDQSFASSNLGYALLQGYPGAGIPTINSINGISLAPTSSDPSYATNNVETVALPGKTVTLGGSGFDLSNSVAVDLFCACPPTGKLEYDVKPASSSLISFVLPASGPTAPPTGPGSFVVTNLGDFKASNAVSVPVGAQISVTSVTQSGSTITVNGTGFSTLTVINFFNTQGGVVKNLGGYVGGKPAIPLNFKSANQFTFEVPPGAQPGASYLQALNPPFVPYTSSGNTPGGAFTLS